MRHAPSLVPRGTRVGVEWRIVMGNAADPIDPPGDGASFPRRLLALLWRLSAVRPRSVLLGAFVLTAASLATVVNPGGPSVLRLRVDSSTEALLPQGNEERLLYDRARLLVGGGDPIVVVLGAPDVLAADALDGLARIASQI